MSAENTRSIESNVFYVDVKVFLEGVQVPHISASVSYGTGEPPTCTITIPANNFLRSLPSATKVLIVFKDLIPDKNGVYKWRVLFDGELSAINYSISPEGAYLTLSAIHTTAYITLMQIISLPANEFVFERNHQPLGDTVFASLAGANKVIVDIIDKIMKEKNYDNMADVVYLLLRNILEIAKSNSATGKWYWDKLGSDLGGYKILDRIYGVSDKAKQAQLIENEPQGGPQRDVNKEVVIKPTASGLTTAVVGEYVTKGSYNYGSTTYKVYATNGAVGTGGDTPFGDVMTSQMEVFIMKNTSYELGSSGYVSTDCGQSVKDALTKTLGKTSLPEFPRYVPDQIIWAKRNGYWHEGNEAGNAKAGDAIIVNGDGHVVISDGSGGYYGMSSSADKMTHNSSVTGAFKQRVTGYIDLNKYYADMQGTR